MVRFDLNMERGTKEFAELMARCEKNAPPDSEIDFTDMPRITKEEWDRSMSQEEAKAFRAAMKKEAATV
jgi:hypothetical protein